MTRLKFRRARYLAKIFHPLRARRRIEHALDFVLEVGGGYRAAVGEAGVAAQVKREDPRVGRLVPAASRSRAPGRRRRRCNAPACRKSSARRSTRRCHSRRPGRASARRPARRDGAPARRAESPAAQALPPRRGIRRRLRRRRMPRRATAEPRPARVTRAGARLARIAGVAGRPATGGLRGPRPLRGRGPRSAARRRRFGGRR